MWASRRCRSLLGLGTPECIYESNRLVYRSARISTRCETGVGLLATAAGRTGPFEIPNQPRKVPGGLPPDMRMLAPLQYEPFSPSKNATPSAISLGWPRRPQGIFEKSKFGHDVGDEVGVRHPRRDCVDADAVGRQFVHRASLEGVQRALAHGVQQGSTDDSRTAADVDDRSARSSEGGFPPRSLDMWRIAPCSTAPDRRRSRA